MDAPEFPPIATDLSDADKQRISEKAWEQAHGSPTAHAQLCAEHARGEIDLFSENPTAIRPPSGRRRAGEGNGDPRLTATGGETMDDAMKRFQQPDPDRAPAPDRDNAGPAVNEAGPTPGSNNPDDGRVVE